MFACLSEHGEKQWQKGKEMEPKLVFSRTSDLNLMHVIGGDGHLSQSHAKIHVHPFNPYNAEMLLYKLWRPKGFFNLKSS